ncbi:MAG: DUF1461 domain-containing protein [Nanoarchaeota archaeon]|nr:DUF1461 domain-containing protein [Nanoarchaeota archaeon]
MRSFRKSVSSILIVSLVIIIFASSFSHYLFNEDFYEEEYEKQGSNDRVGKNVTQAATYVLFQYYRNKVDISGINAFTDEEKSHLADVKKLIAIGYLLYSFAVAACILCVLYFLKQNYTPMHILKEKSNRKKKKSKHRLFDYEGILKDLAFPLQIASMITIVLLLVKGILFISGGFSVVFTGFHQIFFPMGNWQFPDNYLLIQLYPQGFFLDASILVFRRTLIVAFIGLVISLGATLALPKKKT